MYKDGSLDARKRLYRKVRNGMLQAHDSQDAKVTCILLCSRYNVDLLLATVDSENTILKYYLVRHGKAEVLATIDTNEAYTFWRGYYNAIKNCEEETENG